MSTSDFVREIQERGYCVLREQVDQRLIIECRDAFLPLLTGYLRAHAPNRGPCRHYLAMPFESPCFAPAFFFDRDVLNIVRGAMRERIVADQWGCDVALPGSEHQELHVDYRRPLFEEDPDVRLPVYVLLVSFGLVRITAENGAIEIALGTHRMPREEALDAVKALRIRLEAVPLEIGDVLIRHPWALHRGTPNQSQTPRPLVTVRYVRAWYTDDSREVNAIGRGMLETLTAEQRRMLRFPIVD